MIKANIIVDYSKSSNIGTPYSFTEESYEQFLLITVKSVNDGEKNITLRYDLSSPLARFVAQNNQQLPLPYKRYAIQNVFRNEKAGNARYREFTQADCDIVGSSKPLADAEMCNLLADTLYFCGLEKNQDIQDINFCLDLYNNFELL